jgi:hypothetical protein
MAENRIWTGYDADVFIYLNDEDGNRILPGGGPWSELDGPLLTYCYFQDMDLTADLPNTRRPVTGRPNKRIECRPLLSIKNQGA